MKKLLIVCCAVLFGVSASFAADFAPTLMKLTAEPVIQYDFDGSDIRIPVEVSGTQAGVIFSVYTRGKASDIVGVHNGFLGWHYVNKVDTCIYYSSLRSMSIGGNEISWDGKDQDGNIVPPGDYTYYMWAFDNQGAKQQMCNYLPSGWGFDYTTDIQEVDEKGLPLSNPIWVRSNLRWKFGGDPKDSTLVESTTINFAEGWGTAGDPLLHPTDFNLFYVATGNTDAGVLGITKYKWVPNGDAELQSDFGEGGVSETFSSLSGASYCPGVNTNGDYLFTGDCAHFNPEPDAEIYIFDYDGFIVSEVDLTEWWSDPEALEVGAQMNGGPNNFTERHGYLFLNSHANCTNQMVDPVRYLDSGELEDFFVWTNENGDYVLDHNFEETASLPWVCNDYNVGPYKYSISADDNLFTAVNAYDVGAVSFGLMGPDGTGIGYFAFAGETAGWKKGELFVDSETPFDGCYCDNEHTGGTHYDFDKEKKGVGIYFLGHDSITGVITNAVAVADDAPSAFSVAQNSPNPFNPTTTINFSLAQSGDVTVDVFNVAGQKIDTLVRGFMDAGSHSVVWDASGFSAGVYFYTVKSGGYTKTMKMTLLK